jgi:2-keto-4-pentenoate hydratase/2-oxohepta-3-ene-1,7-dioic acid hydratase in catechol pathway
MKIAPFGNPQRIGVVPDDDSKIVDLNLAYAAYLSDRHSEPKPHEKANAVLPASLLDFLYAGDASVKAAEEVLEGFILPKLEAGGPSPLSGPAGEKIVHEIPAEVQLTTPPLPSLASRIFCAALNFPSHNLSLQRSRGDTTKTLEGITREMKASQIYGFCKYPQAVVGNDATVNVPRWVKFLDYETELAAFIGRKGGGIIDGKPSPISNEEAKGMIVGYSCFNDWSVRDEILIVGYEPLDHNILNFTLRKNIPGSSLGPYLVIEKGMDPYGLKMTTRVNGKVRQNGSLAEMVSTFEDLIVYLSRFITLYPGDIITSGTMAGTAIDSSKQKAGVTNQGEARVIDDSLFLKEGDTVEGTISGVGTLRNRVHFA